MNNNSYLELLNQTFQGSVPPDKEQVFAFVEQTMEFFRSMKKRLDSEDPDIREQAAQEMAETQKATEAILQKISENTGLSMAELVAFGNQPFGLPQEEMVAAENIRTQFQKFQEEDQKQEPKNNINLNNRIYG